MSDTIKSLTILGRRWFQRGPGNTYHSATILIDGKPAGHTGIHYGYGEQYIETAFAQLEANGQIPPRQVAKNGSHEPGWQWAERLNIALHCEVSDVPREKDLK